MCRRMRKLQTACLLQHMLLLSPWHAGKSAVIGLHGQLEGGSALAAHLAMSSQAAVSPRAHTLTSALATTTPKTLHGRIQKLLPQVPKQMIRYWYWFEVQTSIKL